MSTEATVPAGSKAVLVGVSAYADPKFPDIRAARNSVAQMRATLTEPALCGWPADSVTTIVDPSSATDLAVQIAELAEDTHGVMLFYYAGHGTLSPQGDLHLTVTTTRELRPKLTGIAWTAIAETLRESPATVRIAILDCCFSGQAIEVAAADSAALIADSVHIEGVYTLTATTRNRVAHVPPPDQQHTAATSFTQVLLNLITTGVPGGPQALTLGSIYPLLRARLLARGLPRPDQRGTDTADRFLFTRNAAHPSTRPKARRKAYPNIRAKAEEIQPDASPQQPRRRAPARASSGIVINPALAAQIIALRAKAHSLNDVLCGCIYAETRSGLMIPRSSLGQDAFDRARDLPMLEKARLLVHDLARDLEDVLAVTRSLKMGRDSRDASATSELTSLGRAADTANELADALYDDLDLYGIERAVSKIGGVCSDLDAIPLDVAGTDLTGLDL
jgi:hypothetical protein